MKSSTKCEDILETPCENEDLGNTILCTKPNGETKKKYSLRICEKIRTFALKNYQMIQRRNMSKTTDQLSSIIAKHLAIGSDFAMFYKAEQRLFEKSSQKMLSNLETEIEPMRKKFETVESMLQQIQDDLLNRNGE